MENPGTRDGRDDRFIRQGSEDNRVADESPAPVAQREPKLVENRDGNISRVRKDS